MGVSQTDVKGWLYTIRYNRFRLQFSRKRYFILQGNRLQCYKTGPISGYEEPVRSAIIDSCVRITDNGRESIHRKIFFIFTLSNTLNNNDQLKLGASSPEEAAKWIRALQDATIKESTVENFVAVSKKRWPYLRIVKLQMFRQELVVLSVKIHYLELKALLHSSKRSERKYSIDWTLGSSIHSEATTTDVIAPSPWKIFGCQNGLRLFKEAKDWESHRRRWEDNPAIMAVGMVDATSEAIFWTLMSLDTSRSEFYVYISSYDLVQLLKQWLLSDNGLFSFQRLTYKLSCRWDFCFYRGSVIEHLDGHTDIVHKQLYSDWLPWGMKRRDLLMRRYWRREDDGTYVILYHSVFHKKCPPKRGYVRACLKSGGFVISPANQGKQSLVKHMLSVDWKFWKLYLRPASARTITIRMLERVAALRELFRAKEGNSSSEFSSIEWLRDNGLPHSIEFSGDIQCVKSENKDVKTEVQSQEVTTKTEKDTTDELEKPSSERTSLFGLHDVTDEFFDVPEATEDMCSDQSEWSAEFSPEVRSVSKLSSAAGLVKKLHDFAVNKKGYMDLQELPGENEVAWSYGSTLQKDSSFTSPCSWAAADPSTFLIRGETYLKDHQKVKAKGTLTQMIGADWLRSDQREDDLGGRLGGIVQNYAARGGPEFFFVVNIQVPGVTMYNLALYYMMKTPLEENPLLHSFVNGDDAFRNSRFKLIPYISKGSWIVKQSVGKKACLVGQALEVHYFHGKNYLEVFLTVSLYTDLLNTLKFQLAVDVGSSTVARGVVSLVLGYLNNLVIEMAFLVQGNTEEELPESLLGTCRLNNLDVTKSVQVCK
ncbi:hypothetical protein JRO89_XS14G0033700 [Xanthoceras sorbifolium]|uniref:Protein ENHANCED DISEASE RESISTANCE 2-like n=1 Tax=Xanthoceras sorbifolium TaxID=99658 RepID=A0ABQ8H3L0_9ROSI|nr:hypothetical protein JRO89_XS14G0033700 [Xanthoceras sorbifolium]